MTGTPAVSRTARCIFTFDLEEALTDGLDGSIFSKDVSSALVVSIQFSYYMATEGVIARLVRSKIGSKNK